MTPEQLRDRIGEMRRRPGTQGGTEEAIELALWAVAAEREATAKICDEYADRMDRSAKAREDAGTPSMTAECKADAGQSLAAAIRSRP